MQYNATMIYTRSPMDDDSIEQMTIAPITNIRVWHKWACILHISQALLIMILISSGTIYHETGIFNLTRTTTVWTKGFTGTENDSHNKAMVGNFTLTR